MAEIIRIIVNGVRNVGMADDVRSIFASRPPRSVPAILNCEDAASADADALASDWSHIGDELIRSYEKEIGSLHV